MSKYVFEGEVIKINERDYSRMMQLYPNLDLGAELEQLDFELRDTKKWWGQVQAKLNYRNKVNAKSRSNETGKSAYQQRVEDIQRRTYGPDAKNF